MAHDQSAKASLVSGLCWLPSGSIHYQQLPLQNVRVDATLIDLCAEVKIQQTYLNNIPHPLQDAEHTSCAANHTECTYIFPLDEDSAVFSFEAELDGVVVKGGIREKSEARAEYDGAIASNRSAMLLEQSSDNVFQCKVGNLKYGSVCTITLAYLTLLEQEGRHNRLTLPMVIAPKYTPPNPGPTPPFPQALLQAAEPTAPINSVHKGFHCNRCLCSPIIGTRHRCDQCAYDLCDGCYSHHDMGHPMHTYSGPTPASEPPLTSSSRPTHTTVESQMRDLTIKLNITMPSPIVSIQCPSNPEEAKICLSSNGPSNNHGTVFLHSESTCSLSKDFIILVEQQRCFEPRVLCELDVASHTAAVSLAFIPPPIDMVSASQIRCELVFLIDCSGSMNGSSIACVRECMQLLLRSLPVNSYFNIIKFGSTWSSLFPNSQPYNDTSLSAASHHISGLGADLGGTEIYPPLLHALSSEALPSHPRQVFLLTDGQVTNLNQLTHLTSQHAINARLFTFGIGNSVDRLLCKRLARAGRGRCEFVTAADGGGSAMREKIVRQVARAMQPVLTDVTVDWGRLMSEAMCPGIRQQGEGGNNMSTSRHSGISHPSFLQCPSVAPAIFMSSRYVLYALNVSLPDHVWQQATEGHEVERLKCEISITARSNHPLEKEHMRHSVVLTGDQVTLSGVIHTMAAKERVRELEEKVPSCSGEERARVEEEILQLATQYTLTSSRTSFVIVYNAGAAAHEEVALSSGAGKDGKTTLCFGGRSRRGAFGGAAAPMFGAAPCTAAPTFGAAPLMFGAAASTFGAAPLMFCAAATTFGAGPSTAAPTFGAATWTLRGQAPSTEAQQWTGFAPLAYGQSDLFNCGGNPLDLLANRESNQSFVPRRACWKELISQTAEKDEKYNAFEELILLQSADGSWQLTPALIRVAVILAPTDSLLPTRLTMQSLQAISKEHAVDDVAIAVMLALQLLESHFQDRCVEWEMLATKARFLLRDNRKIDAGTQQKIKDGLAKLLVGIM